MLTEAEHARAKRFRFRADHERFIIRRGLLRVILRRYLPDATSEIQLRAGPNGKPELASPAGADSLQFNLSHSPQLALYAVARAVPVGVDIELVRPIDDLEDVASRFFTLSEATMLQAVSGSRKLEAFFNCWTRKEAILKAMGQGITDGVDGVEVTVAPGETARALRVTSDAEPASAWSLHALRPAKGYVGALAYRGAVRELVCHRFAWSHAVA
jgi:4'-phosphopantetheinyl transferase